MYCILELGHLYSYLTTEREGGRETECFQIYVL